MAPQGRGHGRGRPASLRLAQQPQRMQPRAHGTVGFGQIALMQGCGRVGLRLGNDSGTGHGGGSGDKGRDRSIYIKSIYHAGLVLLRLVGGAINTLWMSSQS